MKIKTLEDALKRIDVLEKELAELKKENEMLKNRNFGGRKKHDETWTAAFNEVVIDFEDGMTVMEIVKKRNVSRRTVYRYLQYYKDNLKK